MFNYCEKLFYGIIYIWTSYIDDDTKNARCTRNAFYDTEYKNEGIISIIKFFTNYRWRDKYQDTWTVLYIYIYTWLAVKAITLVERNSFSREGINPQNILRLLRHFPLTTFLLLTLKIRLLPFEFNYDIGRNKFLERKMNGRSKIDSIWLFAMYAARPSLDCDDRFWEINYACVQSTMSLWTLLLYWEISKR